MRAALSSSTWREVYLNPHQAGNRRLVDSIALGHSLLCLHSLVTATEVEVLQGELFAAEADGTARRAIPRSDLITGHRIPMELLDAPGQELCDDILLRACSMAEEAAPGLLQTLFGADVIDAST